MGAATEGFIHFNDCQDFLNKTDFHCLCYLFSVSSEVGSCITDSGGWESYMDDEDGGTIADQVTRFVSRFVDRVGTEAGISQEHLKSLYTMIPGQFDKYRRPC